jgi:glycosyltransferase involved in cell wall biosynthesis
LKSDFLLLPTRAECFGLVFCEAAAFGVPSVSADTGGVRGAVHEGKNGFLLPPDANGKIYAEKITELWNDRAAYLHLRESARNLFETTLNWDAWAMEVKDYLPV